MSTMSSGGGLVVIAQTSGITRGVNTFGKNRGTELAMHPTVKPVALVADAILDCSKRRGIILDVFAGSGTTPDRSRKGRSRPSDSKNLSTYLVKAARDQVFATARGNRTISEQSSLWLYWKDYWTMAPCHCCDIRT
jgi:hypothetical protein